MIVCVPCHSLGKRACLHSHIRYHVQCFDLPKACVASAISPAGEYMEARVDTTACSLDLHMMREMLANLPLPVTPPSERSFIDPLDFVCGGVCCFELGFGRELCHTEWPYAFLLMLCSCLE